MTFRVRFAVLGAGLVVAVGAYAQGGSLDSSFDGDGYQTTNVGPGGNDLLSALEIDSSGRIVAVGVAGDFHPDHNLGLTRHLADGALDASFAGDGIQVVKVLNESDPPTEVESSATDVAIMADGRIVVGGGAVMTESNYSYLAARFMPDGSLDTTFAGDGVQTTDVATSPYGSGSNDTAAAVALAPNGAVVLAGNAQVDHGSAGQPDVKEEIGLARYEGDGDLDVTFSDDGVHTQSLPGATGQSVSALAVQPDGRLVVAGSTAESDGFVARFTESGVLDPTFSGDGWQRVDFGSFERFVDLALLADGRIVLAGDSGSTEYHGFALARLTSAGELDPGFGSGGKVFIPPPSNRSEGEPSAAYAWGVRVGADGAITVGGEAEPLRFAAVRVAADGTPLSRVTTAQAPETATGGTLGGGDVAVQGDQRVVLGGVTYGEDGGGSGLEYSLVRFASLAGLSDDPYAGEPLPPNFFRVTRLSGIVRSPCDGTRWRRFTGTIAVSGGCRVDARRGRVRVTSAANRDGSQTQSAVFSDGVFRLVPQSDIGPQRPLTELELVGKRTLCNRAPRRGGRMLRGDGKGRFAILGAWSVATVAASGGAKWLVHDRCDGSTLTRVRRGRVRVRDLARRRTATLSAGQRYVAAK